MYLRLKRSHGLTRVAHWYHTLWLGKINLFLIPVSFVIS